MSLSVIQGTGSKILLWQAQQTQTRRLRLCMCRLYNRLLAIAAAAPVWQASA